MGFILYKVEQTGEGTRYTMQNRISAAGQGGVMARYLKSCAGGQYCPLKWQLSGKSLVAAFAPDVDAEAHAVVMDMMPERLAGASLCLVRSLAGYSDVDESDLVIVMRELFMTSSPVKGVDPRQSFIAGDDSRTPDLVESIGISGGLERGTYRWCAPKMNIGAAICR